jgi:hypothetical protein
MLQLLARAPLFSSEDLQRDSSPRGWGPRRGTPAAAREDRDIRSASAYIGKVSGS